MKRVKNLVIGGIQTKIFNLILVTVILLGIALLVITNYQNNMLVRLSAESTQRQQTAIGETTQAVMDNVIVQSIERTTAVEAALADHIFGGLRTQVTLLRDRTEQVLSHPAEYTSKSAAQPDPAQNGTITAQLFWPEGVDPSEPAIAQSIGLLANLSDMLISLYGASADMNACYIALPNGVCLLADDRSADKFAEDGTFLTFDPRVRGWYQLASERGELIFSDVQADVFTGDIGIVCAAPVYADGQLAAVVGADLFLTSMQEAVQAAGGDSNDLCVLNQDGHIIFSSDRDGVFRVVPAAEAADLRQSESESFAALIADAMRGNTDVRDVTLDGKDYIMNGAPIPTVGWALLASVSKEAAGRPAANLKAITQSIQEETAEAYRTQSQYAKNSGRVLIVAVVLLMLAAALILAKRIVKPLNTITQHIAGMRDGNLHFEMEDTYRTGDEIEELATSFATLSRKNAEYVEQVRTVTAEKERIGAELSLATDIQKAMLPHIFPPFPDRKEFDIFASMDPAKEVGGDFFDYFLIDDDHLCMLIADVSGKGVPAALFMMASKILLQSIAMLGKSPAEILTKANEAICSNNEAEMFVTVWLGILTISTGQLTAANAGHEYPAIRRAEGGFELYKDRHGFVIGVMEGARYREYDLQLHPGDKLFVYTDGVPEATNAGEELFGVERMLDALNREPDAAPTQALHNVRTAVDGFVQEAQQFDDLTMLCMAYKGPVNEGGAGA